MIKFMNIVYEHTLARTSFTIIVYIILYAAKYSAVFYRAAMLKRLRNAVVIWKSRDFRHKSYFIYARALSEEGTRLKRN
jgi:hypothetical protein